jgi:hypothetical protein
MMKCKRKEVMEKIHSPAKVSQKQALVERKEIQKMLKRIHMGSKGLRMGKKGKFGRFVYYSLDNTTGRLVRRIFTYLGVHKQLMDKFKP